MVMMLILPALLGNSGILLNTVRKEREECNRHTQENERSFFLTFELEIIIYLENIKEPTRME